MKLDPLLYVSDLQASVKFYTKRLGFELGELYPDSKNPTYAPISIGENKLMLVQARNENKKFYPKGLGGSGVQFFVQVESVDNMWRRLKNGVEIVDKIENKPWGDWEFTINDPDGYLISFYSALKET